MTVLAKQSTPGQKRICLKKNCLVDKGLRECGWVLMSFRQEWKQCSRRVMLQKKKKKKADGYKAASPSLVCRSPCCTHRSPLFLSPNEYHSHIKRSALAKVAFRIWDFFFPTTWSNTAKSCKTQHLNRGYKDDKISAKTSRFLDLKVLRLRGLHSKHNTNKQLQFLHFAAFSKKGNALRANHLCNVNDGERVKL